MILIVQQRSPARQIFNSCELSKIANYTIFLEDVIKKSDRLRSALGLRSKLTTRKNQKKYPFGKSRISQDTYLLNY